MWSELSNGLNQVNTRRSIRKLKFRNKLLLFGKKKSRQIEVDKKLGLPRNPIDRRRRQFSAPRCTSWCAWLQGRENHSNQLKQSFHSWAIIWTHGWQWKPQLIWSKLGKTIRFLTLKGLSGKDEQVGFELLAQKCNLPGRYVVSRSTVRSERYHWELTVTNSFLFRLIAKNARYRTARARKIPATW